MKPDSRLRILHVLGQRPDATGSGIYLQAMMREAAARGHENHMIAGTQPDPTAESDVVPAPDHSRLVRFAGEDLPFRIPGMTDIMPYPSVRFIDLTPEEIALYETVFTHTLQKAVTAFRPDIIHSHHLWLVSSLIRRLFPAIPVVASCHGTDLRQFQNCRHLRAKVRSGCDRLDAALALSSAQKTDIIARYGLPPDRVRVTGAGYDEALFHAGPKPAPRPVQLVYAGKFIRAKGLPWLLQALAAMATTEWHLHLVGGGSGPQTEECLRLAENLGDRVTLHGQIPQSRLAAIFRQSHIFVLSSFFEGLPLVVLEALASGCRVIATDLPGVREIASGIPPEFLTVVPTPRLRNLDQPHPEDLPAFEQALTRALETQVDAARNHPRLDLAPIAERLAAFSWRGIFDRIQGIYFDVIQARRNTAEI